MATEKVWNSGRVMWQNSPELDVPEAAILIHVDEGGGTIVLQQEDRYVVLSPSSVNEFCAALRETAKKPKRGGE